MRFLQYISVFILLISTSNLQAQGQKELLLSTPQAAGTYVARDKIKLSQGFSAKSSSGVGKFTLDATITPAASYGSLSASGRPSNQTAFTTSNVVGTIAGSADVSSSGAATYTIPIVIPTGTAGMEPELFIMYNSQNSNGQLGKSWSLTGLSTINLAPKNYYYNFAEANFAGEEYGLELDGSRLILINGMYGFSGSEYRTEIDSYKKITLTDNGFIVLNKDGTVNEYGSNANSTINSGRVGIDITLRSSYSFRLTKTTDKNGNFISYTYGQADGESWIQQINYTGNTIEGLSTFAKIVFMYDIKTDKNILYTHNYKITQSRLLSKIEVSTKETLFRQYDLSYSYDGFSTLLSEIKETGTDGKSFNTTKIKWGPSNTGDPYLVPTGIMINNSPVVNQIRPNQQIIAGDFNGDGKNEFLSYREGDINKIYNTGTTNPNTDWTLYNKPTSASPFTQLASGIFFPYTTNLYVNYLNVVDINKDGKDELLQLYVNKYNKFHIVTVKVYQFINNTFQDVTAAFPDFSRNYAQTVTDNNLRYEYKVYTGDFDGDNNTDLMLSQSVEHQASIYNVFRCKIIDIDQVVPIANTSLGLLNYGIFVANINGNTKTDIITVSELKMNAYELNTSTNTFESISTYTDAEAIQTHYSNFTLPTCQIFIKDFNGDGLSDILYKNDIRLYFSYSKNSIQNNFIYIGEDINSDNPLLIGDFIGDEKIELLRYIPDIGPGFDFFSVSDTEEAGLVFISHQDKPSSTNSVIDLGFFESVNLVDYNSDGKDDFLFPERDNQYHVFSFTNDNGANGLVTSIENGFSNITNFNYAFINNTTAYTYSNVNSPSIFSYCKPIKVTTNMNQQFGGAYTNNINYSYRNILFNTNGIGYMGFDQVVKNYSTIAKTEVYNYAYPINFSFNQFLTKVSSNDKNGQAISESNYALPVITTTGKVIRLQQTSNTKKDFIKGTSSTAVINYNSATGNVTSTVEKVFDDITTTTLVYEETNNNQYGLYGSWCPSSLTLNTNTKRFIPSGDAAITNETKYEYDNLGNLDYKYEFNNDIPKTIKTHYYNRKFGLPQSTEISSPNANPVVETKTGSVLYDVTGRFVIESINTLNQVSKSFYNPLGRLVSETGVDGITISHNYDGFGREIYMLTPVGSVTKTFAWTQGSPSGSLYSVTTTATDKPTSITYYDAADRVIKSQITGRKNSTVCKDNVYNIDGTLQKTSKPYYANLFETPIWIENTVYDNLFRLREQKVNALITRYNYDNSGRILTVTDPKMHRTVTYTNALGLTTSVEDAKNNITSFTYNNLLLPKNTGTNILGYDDYGHKTSLNDPNAGITTYAYDAYGRLFTETNAGGTYTLHYDGLNRPVSRTGPDENIVYTYNTSGKGINQPASITNTVNNNGQTYAYDNLGRLTSLKEQSGGQVFETKYEYDLQNGNLIKQVYPTGFTIKKSYEKGYLKDITRADNNTAIWTQGNISSTLSEYTFGNNQTVSYKFSTDYNILTGINVDNKFNWTYNFEKETGNLKQRKDLSLNALNISRNLVEDFTYDELDRLTTISQNTVLNNTINYTNNGNINSKTDAGSQYAYHVQKIHAVEKIKPSTAFSSAPQAITYNGFSRPAMITEDGSVNNYTLSYGIDRERVKSVLKANNQIVETKYFANSFEREIKGSITRDIHYIASEDGTVATYITTNNADGKMYYLLTDYLGSILQLRKDDGSIEAEMSYDAWGRRRKPENWSTSGVTIPTILSRGYTGHEHLDVFNLINMNARLYDPQVGRMLSPDNEIQDANNSQNYNRYSYVINNPLKYADPTGNFYGNPSMSPGYIGPSGGRGGGGGGGGHSGGNPGGGNSPGGGNPGGGNNESKEVTDVNNARDRVNPGLPPGFPTVNPPQAGWEMENLDPTGVGQGGGKVTPVVTAVTSSSTPVVTSNGESGGSSGGTSSGVATNSGGGANNGGGNGISPSGGNQGGGSGYSQNDATKIFIAIVVGESSNNKNEAAGIGSVMINRLNYKKSTVSDGFVKKIGGAGQYDAIGGKAYLTIINSTWENILSSSNPYARRIAGAIMSLNGIDYSNGAYFWNASSPQTGFNWNMSNNGTFSITTTIGQTTFFKYSSPTKRWP